MVGGVRARGRLRDEPALPRRKGSAGPNGDCEKCGMGCLNFELSAERYQLKNTISIYSEDPAPRINSVSRSTPKLIADFLHSIFRKLGPAINLALFANK